MVVSFQHRFRSHFDPLILRDDRPQNGYQIGSVVYELGRDSHHTGTR